MTADRWRRAAAWALTGLAALLVLVVLVAPNDLDRFSPGAFLRIPAEGLLGVVLVLVLPGRARWAAALAGGALLGLMAVLKILDIGFDQVLYRPFDLVLDWPLLGPAVDFVEVTAGPAAAVGAVVGAIVLALVLVASVTLAVLRLSRLVSGHRPVALRVVAVLAVAWITLPGTPVTSDSAAVFVFEHARRVGVGLHDQEAFAAEAAVDAFRDTPGDRLLTSLRGKEVVVVFVESYGRDAVEDPEIAPSVTRVLDDGTRRLRDAGFTSRSAFLTSPTAGGGSWLAQATLLSGLWIDNQQRYRNLVSSDRLTLNGAFRRADWRTVGVMPGITQAWPEGAFFGHQRILPADGLGYRGPRFGYATTPDQYTLAAFERSKGDSPVMATIALVTSHAPWSPVPRLLDWRDLGDGSVFADMPNGDVVPEAIFTRDPAQVRADYRRSIEYSLSTLVSYVENYGDDDLVLLFLGDHQPAQVVTGGDAGRDVPITLVSRDPAVFDRIAGWGWDEGLKPGPQAAVWRMNAFRDRFLSAFGQASP
ncbi:sulfatase [Actinosynnema sp. CS-041913]|uniref:sulfatase n=1 Tax=Actinosynnema sp. CS-041913 TaxID=3239917 RepID=UPI003D920970